MANSERAEDGPKHVKMPGDVVATSIPDPLPVAPRFESVEAASVPSFAAASQLLSAPYSCLVMNTHRRHIALPPMFLNKKKTGITEELDVELLKYSQRLSGVPLAYDNIRIIGHRGDIYDDNGFVHLNIEANFILFKPMKGQTLLGKVNKLGMNHVGCLIHGCFNASIPKPNLVSIETWRDAGPQIDSDLEFDVTALDADTAGVLLIRGRLHRTRVQELLAIAESTVSYVDSAELQPVDPEEAQTTQDTETPPEETPKQKKKKKKKKDKIKEEPPQTPEKNRELDTTLPLNGTMNGMEDETDGNSSKKKKKKKHRIKEEQIEEPVSANFPTAQDTAQDSTMEFKGTMDETVDVEKKKKKKKKKDKHVKEEPMEVEVSSMEVHGSDSSGYLSDKSSKKRKLKTEALSYICPGYEVPSNKKIKTLIEYD